MVGQGKNGQGGVEQAQKGARIGTADTANFLSLFPGAMPQHVSTWTCTSYLINADADSPSGPLRLTPA